LTAATVKERGFPDGHEGTVQSWRQKKMKIEDDCLRRMGPVHFGHANSRGTFRYAALSRHRDAVIDVTSPAKAQASS
jgi:hypothetical protein